MDVESRLGGEEIGDISLESEEDSRIEDVFVSTVSTGICSSINEEFISGFDTIDSTLCEI